MNLIAGIPHLFLQAVFINLHILINHLSGIVIQAQTADPDGIPHHRRRKTMFAQGSGVYGPGRHIKQVRDKTFQTGGIQQRTRTHDPGRVHVRILRYQVREHVDRIRDADHACFFAVGADGGKDFLRRLSVSVQYVQAVLPGRDGRTGGINNHVRTGHLIIRTCGKLKRRAIVQDARVQIICHFALNLLHVPADQRQLVYPLHINQPAKHRHTYMPIPYDRNFHALHSFFFLVCIRKLSYPGV